MINRFNISCKTCKHNHTLRITLGTDKYQEHIFNCYNCGEQIKVALDIDFNNRKNFKELPGFSYPSATFTQVENCLESDTEGTIINLDPNFLVSEENMHKDYFFNWMVEAHKIGLINKPTAHFPFINDVITGVGGERNLKEKLKLLSKSYRLHSRNNIALSSKNLEEFANLCGFEQKSLDESILFSLQMILGQSNLEDLTHLMSEISYIQQNYHDEYNRFRNDYLQKWEQDSIDGYFDILDDYLASYEDFYQAFIYAKKN